MSKNLEHILMDKSIMNWKELFPLMTKYMAVSLLALFIIRLAYILKEKRLVVLLVAKVTHLMDLRWGCISIAHNMTPRPGIFFSDTTLSLSELFRRKEMVLAPILIGSLKRQNPGDSYNPTVYTIKEGWLLLGDNECIYTTAPDFGSTHYDFVYSYSCARFEFVAKSDSGEVLNVTDGYCKYDFF